MAAQGAFGTDYYPLQASDRVLLAYFLTAKGKGCKSLNSASHRKKEPAWLSEQLRRWSNKPDMVGLIPVTTEYFLISCDSNQVPKWFGTHYNLEVQL